MPWINACDLADVQDEDALRFDHGGRTFAICQTDADEVFCVDGLCPRDGAHLAGGLVEGSLVECPDCGGLYDLRNGLAGRASDRPVAAYPLRIEAGRVLLLLPDSPGTSGGTG